LPAIVDRVVCPWDEQGYHSAGSEVEMPAWRSRVRALLPLVLLVAAGCQDYNFNPVGHCIVQPGSKRVTLSTISTADVLFVVDDSGSMGGEQQLLASSFSTFIQNLNATNAARRAANLEPIDFHLAVTTTSIFVNDPTTASCRSDCPTAVGDQVCCYTSGSTPLHPFTVAKSCTADTDCGTAGSGATGTGTGHCGDDCQGFVGEKICCDATTKLAPATETVACPVVGAACGNLEKHYRFDAGSCSQGAATNGALYPHGAFVGIGSNPRVLHFDKELYPATTSCTAATVATDCKTGEVCEAAGWANDQLICQQSCAVKADCPSSFSCVATRCTPTNKQGFLASQLEGWFEQNVVVGTCGSGEEQGLQAGRLAVQQATAVPTLQRDTRNASGLVADSPAQWPHQNSKLVTVFVGDEDDCSSPEDPTRGVIMNDGPPGADACVADTKLPADQQKEFAVSQFVDYFASLGRPMGAAFIVSTQDDTCQDDTCSAGQCCTHYCSGAYEATCRQDDLCGGQAGGARFLNAAHQFKSKGADVVAGSICDNFGTILGRIADIVKPPTGLVLPTQPAGSDIAVLRIADASGNTRKTCRGPAPATLTAAEAESAGWGWWFTAGRDQVTADQKQPTGPTTFIYINHLTGGCEANPGETYSADYLGQVPEGGCAPQGTLSAEEVCARTLGGQPTDWTCFAGLDAAGQCIPPSATVKGTCLCGETVSAVCKKP
jgi:hypothetical protein